MTNQSRVVSNTNKVRRFLLDTVNPNGVNAGVVAVDVVEVAWVDGEDRKAGRRLEEHFYVLRAVLDSKILVVEDVPQ